MNNSFQAIASKCFVNVPWYELKNNYLDFILSKNIQPEIGLEGNCLYDEHQSEFMKISQQLQDHHLSCTLHAPFFDLAPGGLDPVILEKSRVKLRLAFELLDVFKPKSIVCHLQFEQSKQGYKFDKWYDTAIQTWSELVEFAGKRNIPVMLENTYENDPQAHQTILTELDSPYARFCLDVGHLMSFAKSDWRDWLPELAPWLGQLHLHDNHGDSDAHLAPGRGNFDFPSLFTYLNQNNLHPLITLEPHSEEDLEQSFSYLAKTGLLNGI